jgi:hypothetical protein
VTHRPRTNRKLHSQCRRCDCYVAGVQRHARDGGPDKFCAVGFHPEVPNSSQNWYPLRGRTTVPCMQFRTKAKGKIHRRDAESAETENGIGPSLRQLRLCGGN